MPSRQATSYALLDDYAPSSTILQCALWHATEPWCGQPARQMPSNTRYMG